MKLTIYSWFFTHAFITRIHLKNIALNFKVPFETIDDQRLSKMENSMHDTHVKYRYTKELKHLARSRNIYKIIGSIVAINVGNAILLIKSRGELTGSAGR